MSDASGEVPFSQSSARALVGKDGFLFLSNDSNKLLDQHTGRVRLPQKVMASIAAVQKQRRQLLAETGGEYLHVIVPNKETVLAGHLPPEYKMEQFGSTPVKRYLMNRPDVRPFTLFMPEALSYQLPEAVYRKDDTHWTAFGAYQYLAAICASVPSLQSVARYFLTDFSVSVEYGLGDLSSKLPGCIPSPVRQLAPTRHAGELVYFNGLANRGRVRLFENVSAPDPRTILVTQDSFGDRLYAILPSIFSKVMMVHTADFSADLVRQVRPDIYLNIQVERFFVRPTHNGLDLDSLVVANGQKRGTPVDLDAMHQALDRVFPRVPELAVVA